MYEDTWYHIVPEFKPQDEGLAQKPVQQRRRKESLLKQPNETDIAGPGQIIDPLDSLREEQPQKISPPKATLTRRAKSYTDFYHVARAQITKDARRLGEQERKALEPPDDDDEALLFGKRYDIYEDELLDASLEEFQLYRDQLALSERHLDSLINDTSGALGLLANLADSFKAVDAQTTAFRAQCEGLLTERKHFKTLADEVGTGLQYYSYLEPITRRLNAPGASAIIGDDSFVEIMTNLDACIQFMYSHPKHRESDTYYTRYHSLRTRTLSLLQIAFTNSIRSKASEAHTIMSKASKMNTTTLYLIQAPDVYPTGNRLQRSMEHIISMAKPILDPSVRHVSQPGNDSPSTYYALFNTLMDEYVASRRALIAEVLGQVLTGTIAEDHDPKSDFGKYARACLNTTLEVCMNEYSKYALFFGQVSVNVESGVDFFRVWRSQETLNKYLEALCTQTFGILEPSIQRADTAIATQLALWLDNYVPSADIDDESAPESNDIDGNAELKAHLAIQLKSLTTQAIFTRIKEILYANVTRFFPKPEDLKPQKSAGHVATNGHSDKEPSTSIIESADADIVGRAHTALGDGFSNAYGPLRTGIQLLILNNDLTFDTSTGTGMGEMAYEIIHETSTSIMRAAGEIARTDRIDSHIFAIKNLVLLKNLILAYEISGSRQAAALDFTRMWTTFSELRSRGGLFDVRAYYTLITTGELLPEVVTTVQDARVELDGLLRETITKFREQCAALLWKQYGFPLTEKAWAGKKKIRDKLEVMFTNEVELRDNLWAAVEDTLAERRK